MTKNAQQNSAFDFDIARFMSDFKSPMNNMEQVIGIHRRNFEAIIAANQMTVEGIQNMIRRQAEIVRETLEDAGSMLSEIAAAGTPEDKLVRQLERVKKSYDNAMSNVRELTDLANRSGSEAADVVSTRISNSLDEIKSATCSSTSGKKGSK